MTPVPDPQGWGRTDGLLVRQPVRAEARRLFIGSGSLTWFRRPRLASPELTTEVEADHPHVNVPPELNGPGNYPLRVLSRSNQTMVPDPGGPSAPGPRRRTPGRRRRCSRRRPRGSPACRRCGHDLEGVLVGVGPWSRDRHGHVEGRDRSHCGKGTEPMVSPSRRRRSRRPSFSSSHTQPGRPLAYVSAKARMVIQPGAAPTGRMRSEIRTPSRA
jgi:hypothetical protein